MPTTRSQIPRPERRDEEAFATREDGEGDREEKEGEFSAQIEFLSFWNLIPGKKRKKEGAVAAARSQSVRL